MWSIERMTINTLEMPETWEVAPTPLQLYQIELDLAQAKNRLLKIDRQIRNLEARYKKSHPRDAATRDLATEELRAEQEAAEAAVNIAEAHKAVLDIWVKLAIGYAWNTRKM
jgi:hypothetical protein